jgi:hypothetical protein
VADYQALLAGGVMRILSRVDGGTVSSAVGQRAFPERQNANEMD